MNKDKTDLDDNKIKTKKKKINSNAQTLKITYFFLAVFVIMIVYFVKFLIVDGDEVINNPYNKRGKILANSVVRGNILSSDGKILAKTIVNEDGSETRSYPYGSMFAHVVGYSTYGQTGLELQANYKLLTSNAPVIEQGLNDINGKKNIGNNVVSTLDADLTKAAYEAIGNNNAAVIAIDPSTGKILTMLSQPDFDPNEIAEKYETYANDDESSILLNRATNGLYTPGSTFKLFTLEEYIKENKKYKNYTYECNGEIDIEDYSMKCAGRKAHGSENLYDSFAYSCNCSFVNIGLGLDKNKLSKLCNSLMFNSELPVDFPYKKSKFVLNNKSGTFETMQTVIGQGKTLVSPLHLAMIASTIANSGTLMKPYLIDEVQNYTGKTVKKYSPVKVKQLFSKGETETLKEFMEGVVTYGTAKTLNNDNYKAYGKTGTAQIKDGSRDNSLFMGFAVKGDKKIAVCVVLENMPEGSTSAVPVAKAIFDEYFSE